MFSIKGNHMAIVSEKNTATKARALPAKKVPAAARSSKVVTKAAPAASRAKKPVAVKKAKPALKPVLSGKADVSKVKKPKLVRDSFTMPENEYEVLGKVKKMCLSAGVEVKKSQLLRVGLALLNKTDLNGLKTLLADLQPLKAGRPKKEK
jgi:hypothetical protein